MRPSGKNSYLIPRTGCKCIFNTGCPVHDYFNNRPRHHRCFERGGETGGSPSNVKGTLKKWFDRLADALKRLAEKVVEALPAVLESVVGAILSFLGKAVGFVAEHTRALIVFVVGHIGLWLMQKVKKD